MEIIHRATTSQVGDDLEYVISDGSMDRHGTTIEPKGWNLESFKRNPIALFNHDKNFIVGHWENVRVQGGQLRGKLKLLKAGISSRLDEIRAAVEAGVLRAVSVGFVPLPGGVDEKGNYRKQELLEASLVSVGSNKNALLAARALGLSPEGMSLIAGEIADSDGAVRRGSSGEHAAKPNHTPQRNTKMTPISKRIEDAQKEHVAARDKLNEHVNRIADLPEISEEDSTTTDELNRQVEVWRDKVEMLQRVERNLAADSQPITPTADAKDELIRSANAGALTVNGNRPFAVPAQKIAPGERYLRSLVAMVISEAGRRSKQPHEVLAERYGSDGKVDEAQRTVFDVVTRASTAPATTTTSGWASQLVETENVAFMDLLMPASVYPGLASRGLRLQFGRSGILSIPSRSSTPTVAGSFVLEGNPIPVRQAAVTSQTFTPKKMAVISTWTREIAEHSTPAIEGLVRNAMQEDTSVALDTVLLDATAASTTRPKGLREGVSVTTATAGGTFTSLVTDLKNLVGALITASNGNLRSPVWIMNPIQALSISVTQNAGGDFPFANEINNNRFQGYPVIQSSTVTAGMVFLVDAADFVAIEGGMPRFDVSTEATLHLDDTTPLAIGTAGSPNTVAAPVRSLFQTDSVALRMIMDVNWGMRRSTVAWTQSVTW
jgi:HK97 family phage major capsid protein/HK97 family phage prohead protease